MSSTYCVYYHDTPGHAQKVFDGSFSACLDWKNARAAEGDKRYYYLKPVKSAQPIREHRYCGPCGEYYDDGDVLESKDLDPVELLSLTGTECPFCCETGHTVDDLAEQAHEDLNASFHDGGSQRWADIERNR